MTTCTYEHHTPASPALATWVIQCAWCLREQGQPMGNGSHGICTRHKTLVLMARKERKQGRA